MVRDLMVLPGGVEIFSGSGTPAIQSVSLTRCVNSEEELMLGSVCPAMAEIRIIAPKGTLQITAGTEFTLYRVDDGQRQRIGLFTAETPVQTSENIYQLTAYDRVVWLEKDLSGWLAALEGWPYKAEAFAHMVAEACSLTLKNESLLNGAYQIQKFSAQGITGRKLMEWLGQICAKFCRATQDGKLEFAWYTNRYAMGVGPSGFEREGVGGEVIYSGGDLSIVSPAVQAGDDGTGNVTVTGLAVVTDDADGNLVLGIDDGSRSEFGYFSGCLSYEDYEIAPIDAVRLRLTREDAGICYPRQAEAVNPYVITGNYLLTGNDTDALTQVAEGIYRAVCRVSYRPCRVTVPAQTRLAAGDIVAVRDPNGRAFTAYVMTETRKGQRVTLECTGSPRRETAEGANYEGFKSVSGKLFEIRKSVEGLSLQVSRQESQTEQRFSRMEQDADGLAATVSSIRAEGVQNAWEIASVKESVTSVRQTADSVTLQVQSIVEKGVSRVTTGMGYTFDEEGLKIRKPGEEIGNLLDNTGMYVTRSGQTILQANAAGVTAADVKVNNFLIVGEHARFEDYTDGTDSNRTACFWV